jgi:hypothetical protein
MEDIQGENKIRVMFNNNRDGKLLLAGKFTLVLLHEFSQTTSSSPGGSWQFLTAPRNESPFGLHFPAVDNSGNCHPPNLHQILNLTSGPPGPVRCSWC